MRAALAVLIILVSAPLWADVDYREANIQLSARGQALGGACGSLCDDPSALYANPAGLSHVKRTEAVLSFTKWFSDTSIQYAQAAFPLDRGSAAAIGVMYYSLGELDYIDENGYITGDVIRPSTVMISGGYGSRVFDLYSEEGRSLDMVFRVGAALKALFRDSGFEDDAALLLDAGAVMQFKTNARASLVLKNLGILAEFTPPVAVSIGGNYTIQPDVVNKINISGEAAYCADNTVTLSAGLELSVAGNFFLRAGYGWKPGVEFEQGTISGLNGGFALYFMPFKLDYTVTTNGGLGINHMFALSYVVENR